MNDPVQTFLQDISEAKWLEPDVELEVLGNAVDAWIEERIDEHVAAIAPSLPPGAVPPRIQLSYTRSYTDAFQRAAASWRQSELYRSPDGNSFPAARTIPSALHYTALSQCVSDTRAVVTTEHLASTRAQYDERVAQVVRRTLLDSPRWCERFGGSEQVLAVPHVLAARHVEWLLAWGEDPSRPSPWLPLLALWRRGAWPILLPAGELLLFVPVRDENVSTESLDALMPGQNPLPLRSQRNDGPLEWLGLAPWMLPGMLPRAYLVHLESNAEFLLGSVTNLGRASGNDFAPVRMGPDGGLIVADSASRWHARILFHRGSFYLTDLQSTPGTSVNDQAVTFYRELFNRDELRLGDGRTLLRFLVETDSLARPGWYGLIARGPHNPRAARLSVPDPPATMEREQLRWRGPRETEVNPVLARIRSARWFSPGRLPLDERSVGTLLNLHYQLLRPYLPPLERENDGPLSFEVERSFVRAILKWRSAWEAYARRPYSLAAVRHLHAMSIVQYRSASARTDLLASGTALAEFDETVRRATDECVKAPARWVSVFDAFLRYHLRDGVPPPGAYLAARHAEHVLAFRSADSPWDPLLELWERGAWPVALPMERYLVYVPLERNGKIELNPDEDPLPVGWDGEPPSENESDPMIPATVLGNSGLSFLRGASEHFGMQPPRSPFAPTPSGDPPILYERRGPRKGARYELLGSAELGTDEFGAAVVGCTRENVRARVVVSGRIPWIFTMGSTRTVTVNGRVVVRSRPLTHGDTIGLEGLPARWVVEFRTAG